MNSLPVVVCECLANYILTPEGKQHPFYTRAHSGFFFFYGFVIQLIIHNHSLFSLAYIQVCINVFFCLFLRFCLF